MARCMLPPVQLLRNRKKGTAGNFQPTRGGPRPPRISLGSSSNSIRRNSIDPTAIRSNTCVRMSLNSKNRETYHAYDTKAALARLRSGGNRGGGDWNRTDRTARNDDLTAVAG